MAKDKKSDEFYDTVGKNIKKYREVRNYSLQALGDLVGVTKKTIQRYENGEIKIDMGRLSDVAEALKVEAAKLLEGTEAFLGVEANASEFIMLPVLGKTSCGNGMYVCEETTEYEATPVSWLNGGEYFYLRAEGDSMINARIHDGDLVLIRKQNRVDDGDIAAVLIDDEAYLKKVHIQGPNLILQSENTKYPPIVASLDSCDIIILGKLKKVVISF